MAQRNNRMFQFGIYGDNSVIFQRCIKMGSIILFSIEKCSAKDFCSGACLYEYTPQFEFDKSIAYANAVHYYTAGRGNAIPASINLCSVYGDDFTLICMVGNKSFANAFHRSKMGKHYIHTFYMAGMAPAQHHLLAIEEGYVIHFSRGNGSGAPQIILEEVEQVEERAFERWGTYLLQVEYKHEDTANRLVARNRALLVFAGFVSFGDYGLMANNCEHFVSWCKTGKAYSTQVTNFFIDATSILASIIIRNPAPLMVRLAQRKLLLG